MIRVYVDAPQPGFPNGNGLFDPAIDFQIAMTTAIPLDGTNQYPNGHWQATSDVNLNAAPFPLDGLRTFFVTAEDVAGNVNPTPPGSSYLSNCKSSWTRKARKSPTCKSTASTSLTTCSTT